jgi:hypothetical protein
MKATYLKIASFFWKDNTLLNFYVDYKTGEDPFGTFLPISYTGSLNNSVFGFYNRPPLDFKPVCIADISQVFKNFGNYDYLLSEMNFAISASMCFYYCQQTNQEFNLDVFREFYSFEKYNFSIPLISIPLPTYLDNNYTEPVYPSVKLYKLSDYHNGDNLDWSKVHNFYTEDKYSNYLEFAENFEQIVNLNSSIKLLFSGYNEILLAELALKNIGRTHFIGVDRYYSKTYLGFFNSELQKKSIQIEQSEVILNNICLWNAFNMSYYENIPCRDSLFSLSTHIDYNDDEKGNYSIKYNLPVSQNETLGSNFSKNFCNDDVIEVNLKQVMRYSQNYIQFKHTSWEYPDSNFEALREFFTPIFPIDYEVVYNHFEHLYKSDQKRADYFKKGGTKSDSGIGFRYSYLYQFLKDKKILSNRFIEYCRYLHNLSLSSVKIYEDDQKLFMPFWEIPRMQQIFIEKYLQNFWVKEFEEEYDDSDFEKDYSLKELRGFINDGLDDFYDADPHWHWNID